MVSLFYSHFTVQSTFTSWWHVQAKKLSISISSTLCTLCTVMPWTLQFYWNHLNFNNNKYNQSPNQSSITSSRCECICVTCHCQTVLTWIKYCVNTEQDNIASMIKNIHSQIYSDPSQCHCLESPCSHLLHTEDKTAPVSCRNVPYIPHSSTETSETTAVSLKQTLMCQQILMLCIFSS